MTRNDRPAALITGSARRVGRAVALELARAGYDIVVHYRRSAGEAEQTASDVRNHGVQCVLVGGDLADPARPDSIIEQAVEHFGHLDVLVNNASVFEKMPLNELDVEKWHHTMQINLLSPLQLCRAAASYLRPRRGCIVNFIDISVQRPWKHYLAYGPSKAGLEYATRALARALAPDIRVNGVAPGIALFPEHYSQEFRERLIDRVPLKRAGTPEDMARTVRFLVESDYITGQIINVDGGRSII